MKDRILPKLSIIDSLRQKWKRSFPSDVLEAGPVFNVMEGDEVVVTYTSAVDKMKFFSTFIREGLENGDLVDYIYPDEESETVRAKLREYGIDVEKYEKSGALSLEILTKGFMSNGKLDYEKAVTETIEWWVEAKEKGYKHVRGLEDLGDFSFCNGQWQKWVKEYWLDPRWDDPKTSEWVLSDVSPELALGVSMVPFLIEMTAINVERMKETEVTELLKALGGANAKLSSAFIDLIEHVGSFSELIGLDHRGLVGRNILLEFDPSSNYEKVVDRLAKESMANVEPFFVFTSNASPLHAYLAKQPTIRFFLTSISTSTPEAVSENEVLLPAKSVPLILDTLSKVLETYTSANVCVVFDILSELLTIMGREKTFTFLRYALNMLSSEKITSLFLLNSSAHEPKIVSQMKSLFSNQLTYDKNGLEVVKTSWKRVHDEPKSNRLIRNVDRVISEI